VFFLSTNKTESCEQQQAEEGNTEHTRRYTSQGRTKFVCFFWCR